jgi:glycosidase
MPDFNMRNPEVVKYHEESLKFWLDRGIDGFRLDAVPHLIEKDAKDWNDQPESRQLTGQFTRLIKSYPNKYVVCEATAEPKVYAQPEICGGAFAFGLENQISKAAKGDPEAIQKVAQYYTKAPHTLASFASNHDQFAGKRLWDQVNGNEVQYKLAAATYLLLPGTPFIYYGEEIGMAGAKGLSDDPFIRGPYSWLPNEKTAGFTTGQPYRATSGNVSTHHAQIQKAGADSLWSFYRDMLTLRNTRTSLAKGSYEAPQAQGQVLTYQRKAAQEHSVVVINYGTQAVPVTVENMDSNATLRALYPDKGVANQKGGQVTVPAQSVNVFAVEK